MITPPPSTSHPQSPSHRQAPTTARRSFRYAAPAPSPGQHGPRKEAKGKTESNRTPRSSTDWNPPPPDRLVTYQIDRTSPLYSWIFGSAELCTMGARIVLRLDDVSEATESYSCDSLAVSSDFKLVGAYRLSGMNMVAKDEIEKAEWEGTTTSRSAPLCSLRSRMAAAAGRVGSDRIGSGRVG